MLPFGESYYNVRSSV